VAALLSIYLSYVVVVAVADFSKRAGVEWGEVARRVSRRMSGRCGAAPLQCFCLWGVLGGAGDHNSKG
jgi:hypothetical protein